MVEEEEFEQEEETDSEEIKKEKAQLEELGVSDTWNILTKPDSKKKEEKKPEFRGFKYEFVFSFTLIIKIIHSKFRSIHKLNILICFSGKIIEIHEIKEN